MADKISAAVEDYCKSLYSLEARTGNLSDFLTRGLPEGDLQFSVPLLLDFS